jgi:hypothetical protein
MKMMQLPEIIMNFLDYQGVLLLHGLTLEVRLKKEEFLEAIN